MKRFALCLLLLLAACQTPVVEEKEVVSPLDLDDVMTQFAALDSQLGTSWKQERMPDNLINPQAVKPWTASMLFLKDRLASQNDTILINIVEARIEMLRAQVAQHLMIELGEEAQVKVEINDGIAQVIGEINCEKSKEIAQYYKLYGFSYEYYLSFVEYLDDALQASLEARQIIGDNNRPEFYDSKMGAVEKTIAAVSETLSLCKVTA